MDDMVERVARALAPIAWAALETGDTLAQQSRRTASLRHAKTVLEAIREPTEVMVSEGYCEAGGTDVDTRKVWQFMIDAALGNTVGE